MKRLIILVMFFSAIQGLLAQDNHIPYRNMEAVEDGMIVTYHFKGASIFSNPIFPNTYFWKIPNFGINDVEGEPAIPFRWDMFTIPPNMNFEVELLDSVYNDTLLSLSPAMSPVIGKETNSTQSKGITPYQGFFPQETLLFDDLQYYDGYNLLKICVQPVKYDFEHKIVRYFSCLKYKVRYITDNQKESITNTINDINPILENVSLNYQVLPSVKEAKSLRSTVSSAFLETNRHLLIISTPLFADAVNRFAKWKRTKGWTVHIEMNNSWTIDSVKSTVQNVYTTTNHSLKYLLIVGDENFVPTEILDERYPHASDLYYGCVNNSHRPMVHRGRIPVKTNTEAQIVFNKIMNYERNPISESSFYQNGFHCAYFQGNETGMETSRFVRTDEDVRNAVLTLGKSIGRFYKRQTNVTPLFWSNYYADGAAIPDSLRLGHFNWDGSKTEITNNINNGTFYVLYKGHGDVNKWEYIDYTIDDLTDMENNNKLPVFFNICCYTGSFQADDDCFTETLLKKEERGGVGVFAATGKSGMGYSDAMAIGMFDAIWPSLNLRPAFPNISYSQMTPVSYPIYEMGAVLDQGLLRMEETYGRINNDIDNVIRTYELFHFFGDPTMQMYTEKPQNFVMPTISKNGNTIQVQSNDGDARIVFYNPLTESVLSYYGTSAQISTDADSLIICVDRHNYVPFVLQYSKDMYIQNETINGVQNYWGNIIMVGEHVTATKPEGPVVIQNANVKMKANTVELHSGSTIINSNVEINGSN